MCLADPVNGTFHLTVSLRHAAACHRVVFSVNLNNFAVFVFLAAGAFHDVGVFETHFLTWSEAEIFVRRAFHEVFLFDPQLAAKLNHVATCCFIFRVVDSLEFLGLTFRIVGNHELNGIYDGCHTCSAGVEVFTD